MHTGGSRPGTAGHPREVGMGLLSRATRRRLLAGSSALVMVDLAGVGTARAENVLKIGVLGVMSGPAASWGLVNKYCAQTTAQMYNEKGGVDIGGEKYKIEIVPIDDKNDPKLTVSGAGGLTPAGGIQQNL